MARSLTATLAPDNGAVAVSNLFPVLPGESVTYSATYGAGDTQRVKLEVSAHPPQWEVLESVVMDGAPDNFTGTYRNTGSNTVFLRFRNRETSGASTDESATVTITLNDGGSLITTKDSDLQVLSLEGAPTDAYTGDEAAGPGSILVDKTNARLYQNIGTKVDPVWREIGGQTGVRYLRTRKTIGEINAGVTLLAAIAGYKYKITGIKAIAIGGNAGAVTSVDVKGTQSTAAVVLFSFAQANLTRSAVLQPGTTGTTVLADGASFVANDANTAITAIKAGADITTATHVDFLIEYVIEA